MDTAGRRGNFVQLETNVAERRGTWISWRVVATEHSSLRVRYDNEPTIEFHSDAQFTGVVIILNFQTVQSSQKHPISTELSTESHHQSDLPTEIGSRGKIRSVIVTRGPRTLRVVGDFYDPQVWNGR